MGRALQPLTQLPMAAWDGHSPLGFAQHGINSWSTVLTKQEQYENLPLALLARVAAID